MLSFSLELYVAFLCAAFFHVRIQDVISHHEPGFLTKSWTPWLRKWDPKLEFQVHKSDPVSGERAWCIWGAS